MAIRSNFKFHFITSVNLYCAFWFGCNLTYAQSATNGQPVSDAHSVVATAKDGEKSSKDTAPDVDPEHELLLGGANEYLDKYGVQFGLNWLAETVGVFHGGKKNGIDYTHQIEFSLDVDWSKTIGWKGFSTHAVVLNLAGRNTSSDFVGDPFMQAQEIYMSGYNRLFRLYNLYAEQTLWNEKIDIKIGRYNAGDDFAVSPFACEFILSATCSQMATMGTQQGYSAWPSNVWAGRISYKFSDEFSLQFGAYESSPYNDAGQGGPTGFQWGFKKATGAFIPVELGYTPNFGKDKLNGFYRVGGGYDTTRYETWTSQIDGSGKKDNASQYWVVIGQMIHRNDATENHGLYVMANWNHQSPSTSSYKDLFNVGLLDRGFWKARPYDQFGIMFTYYSVPKSLRNAQKIQVRQANTSLGGGFDELLNGAIGVQSHQMVFEANYGVAVYRGIIITPVFEYFHNVGATKNVYQDAALLGFRTNVIF